VAVIYAVSVIDIGVIFLLVNSTVLCAVSFSLCLE